MLKQKDFDQWCITNNISRETAAVIEKIRKSEPVRRVKSGKHSVSGRFASRKMGLTIQFESHKNELAFIYELEHDPDVLEFYDQPYQLKLNYAKAGGRRMGILHVPDFFVIRAASAGFVECKTEEDLSKLSAEKPERYQLDEDNCWICPPGIESANSLGLGYRLQSSREINWVFQRNMEYLDDYFGNDEFDPGKKECVEILQIVKSNPAIILEDLFKRIEKNDPASRDDVHNLIARGDIYVDLRKYLLPEPESVLVYADEQTAVGYSYVVGTPNRDDASCFKIDAIALEINGEILWDGKAWRIVNKGEKEITLIDESGESTEIGWLNLERLLASGKIKQLGGAPDPRSGEHVNILLNAGSRDLTEANQRLNFVTAYLNNDELPKAPPVSTRTIRRWVAAYRSAEAVFGQGYYGLIPKPNNGNRNAKIHEDSKTLLETFIAKDYGNLTGKNRKTVYGAYELESRAQGLVPASYETLCIYVKKRDEYEQVLKRKGPRAAYDKEEFYWWLDETTPRHGERPFHIAHVDHTELDIELIDSKTGINLGRPWLTYLTDAYSRKILALYLTFREPNKISDMMVLRECVRRHGRLPQILVVDGGKDFSCTYFETLLASQGIMKKTRPAAKPRFGSVIERLFRTTNEQFIHNLQGNTKMTKNVRQLTKGVNPKNLAVWNIGDLFVRLCEWSYETYDQTTHSTLGQSPREAFNQAILRGGARANKYIVYDQAFIMLTLPGTKKGTATIDLPRGIKVNSIFYYTQEFSVPGVNRMKVPVKFDPFDMSRAYAYVNKRWRECISEHAKSFIRRSQKQVEIATEELKRRLRLRTVLPSQVARFMNSVESEEVLLKQRIKDREEQRIIHMINGVALPEKAEFLQPEQADAEVQQTEPVSRGNVIRFPGDTENQDESEAPKKSKKSKKPEKFKGYPVI